MSDNTVFGATLTRKASSVLAKIVFIGLIVLALVIPLRLITSLVGEREARSRSAATEIGSLWGGPQRVAGPLLSLPVRERVPPDDPDSPYRRTGRLHLLPEELQIDAEVETLERRRGIFETAVYTARLTLTGRFRLPDRERLGFEPSSVEWRDAVVTLGLSELGGLSESPAVTWDGQPLELEPVSGTSAVVGQGISARIPISADLPPAPDDDIAFEARLVVRGSKALRFLPLGRETRVHMTSDWPDPSFQGAFLPSSPEVRDDGFEASWSIPYFARSYPQHWIDGAGDNEHLGRIDDSAFGLEWLLPVDVYQQTERCVKYAILFIVLTFATFFLFELLNNLRFHPVQYLMVGFAMCLFYQLLLAVSEHLGFIPAYLSAAVATVALIAGYSAAVLKTRQRSVILTVALTVLYGVLFVLVQLQTYTLLVGSAGLFAVLALFMFLTRRLDWYELGRSSPEHSSSV